MLLCFSFEMVNLRVRLKLNTWVFSSLSELVRSGLTIDNIFAERHKNRNTFDECLLLLMVFHSNSVNHSDCFSSEFSSFPHYRFVPSNFFKFVFKFTHFLIKIAF